MDENELSTVLGMQEVDTNGDGTADGIMTVEDTNMDGAADTISVISDTDGNGMADSITIMQDTDGDGVLDVITGAAAVDTTGDGIADTIVVYEDQGADGTIDNMEAYSGDEAMFEAAFIGTEGYESYAPDGYEQFDPEQTDMSNVVGDPVSDADAWEFQGESGPCAIYAQAMAYENVTGEEVDVAELIEAGEEEGWYTGSTTIEDMSRALNYLGIDAEVEYRGDMDDIEECLENGGRVVAAVDADEIWFSDNDTCFTPNSPNHAIEVIGIDYSGEEPMVIINDSGTPDGHGIMVPKEQFLDAWEDSDYAYVEVYPQAV